MNGCATAWTGRALAIDSSHGVLLDVHRDASISVIHPSKYGVSEGDRVPT